MNSVLMAITTPWQTQSFHSFVFPVPRFRIVLSSLSRNSASYKQPCVLPIGRFNPLLRISLANGIVKHGTSQGHLRCVWGTGWELRWCVWVRLRCRGSTPPMGWNSCLSCFATKPKLKHTWVQTEMQRQSPKYIWAVCKILKGWSGMRSEKTQHRTCRVLVLWDCCMSIFTCLYSQRSL